MQELNVQKRFVGKTLDELEFKEIITGSGKDEETATPSDEVRIAENEETGSVANGKDSDRDSVASVAPSKKRSVVPIKKSKNTRKRNMWTDKEKEEIRKYFKDNFRTLITPGKRETVDAIKKSRAEGGELQFRHWHTIVKKMSAELQKSRN
ncbi:MAG: hypothetical protein AB2693_26555 [Candidatus Thiodiazotropha sp.]